MKIRESENNELDAIRALHTDAFGEPQGAVIAQLVCDILKDESANPLISLVMEDQGTVIGHVIFSRLIIEGFENISAYILAPLAVSTSNQRQGVGTQLIQRGLGDLKALGAEIAMVLGNPDYYGRFGFQAGHNVSAPYDLEYPQAWMALELKAGILSKVHGIAQCCSSLMVPEHW